METAWSDAIKFYVNGRAYSLKNPDPRANLLQWLRSEGLTGTKLGCGEGGCGACTVMLSSKNQATGAIKHIAVNACLFPLCSLDGIAVTTVEGIGGLKQGLHPVQARVAAMHGSQCGFCTPGIVMSIYAILRSNPDATPHDIEEALDGNLCRCTGYRPILDAAKSLSNNKSGCCGGGGASGGCPCKEAAAESSSDCCGGKKSDTDCCGGNKEKSGCCGGNKEDSGCCSKRVTKTSEQAISEAKSLNSEISETGFSEPIFPPALSHHSSRPIRVANEHCTWFQPTTLPSLLELKKAYPNARLVVGNTEVGIEVRFKYFEYNTLINPSSINELKVLHVDELSGTRGVTIGAAVSINTIRDYVLVLAQREDVRPFELRGFHAIRHMLTWFASNQIRNAACLGGNIITASPISDMNPMLMALNATLKLTSGEATRYVPIREFFLAYRKVDLRPDEVLESVFVPFTSEFQFIVPLKQARRREDDISIVTSGMSVTLSHKDEKWTVADCGLSFGGMAPTTVLAKGTMALLSGRQWDRSTLEEAMQVLQKEMSLPEAVPGGQAEYRTALSTSFLFRTFLTISNELSEFLEKNYSNGNQLPSAPMIDSRERSAIDNFVTSEKTSSRGEHSYTRREGGIQTSQPTPHQEADASSQSRPSPVGDSVMHKSARAQVCGEAKYTDDLPLPSNALHAALVMSTRAHARILKVDPTPAESCDGFVAYFGAKDVTGNNHIGAVVKDEEVFATEIVRHVGAVIGVVVARTHEEAVYASRRVAVTYEDLPAVVSIEEAIQAKSFFSTIHVIEDGNLSEQEAGAEIVVEGEFKVGGQEHFYLETNSTVCIPIEAGHLEVYSSTQNPTKTQNFCASVLGIPAAHVMSHCKRLGGGFGGKETRSVFIACTAAVAAHHLGRPVSINIERDVDMSITGQRHAFSYKYRAGCTKDGRIKFLDADLYSNGGFSLDLSQAVMDRALFHSDSVYAWPAIRVRGTVCRTNQPSHTAYRGFGGPQGLILSETVIDHLSHVCKIPADRMREMNMYKEGERTHFGQPLEGFHVPRLWRDITTLADVEQRRQAIDAFNNANRYKKRALSLLATKYGINFTAKFMNQGGALVHVYQDGTVLVSHGGTEMGQGLHTKVIQVAAQCLGISDSMVHIAETATHVVANASPTAASMSTDLYGMAVLNACEIIRDRLEPVRARLGPSATWKDVVVSAYFDRIDLSAHGFYVVPTDRCGYDWDMACSDNAQRGNPFNYFTQGVVATEVEIDTLTGDSKVLRVDLTMDLGKSINPALDIGQIEGAFMQGYGWSTMEELVWGDGQHPWVRQGQLFTRGPGTYKIPAFNDVPLDFRVHLADTDNRFAVHSSKAVGEPPFFLGASAYFAIKNAVNVARAESNLQDEYYNFLLPATSERIRMGCYDNITAMCTKSNPQYQPKGSW